MKAYMLMTGSGPIVVLTSDLKPSCRHRPWHNHSRKGTPRSKRLRCAWLEPCVSRVGRLSLETADGSRYAWLTSKRLLDDVLEDTSPWLVVCREDREIFNFPRTPRRSLSRTAMGPKAILLREAPTCRDNLVTKTNRRCLLNGALLVRASNHFSFTAGRQQRGILSWVLALLWQIIHAACLRRSIFGSAGIAAAAVER
jgi:hypothetical protein